LVLALSDRTTPEVTLHLKEKLKSELVLGSQIQFTGVATEFTQKPFMLSFDVVTLAAVMCESTIW
jgi:hypothetical protein